jgi:hypothetical protein
VFECLLRLSSSVKINLLGTMTMSTSSVLPKDVLVNLLLTASLCSKPRSVLVWMLNYVLSLLLSVLIILAIIGQVLAVGLHS